ncbi:MAG: hypothetical protein ACLR0U_27550 [Enterocloster clostridioformis]
MKLRQNHCHGRRQDCHGRTAKGDFSRVKELKSHGLDVPQVTELAWELKEAGIPLADGILSREELVEQLVPLLR